MRTGHYTRLKGRVTYFRRKVPEFLQQRLASTEICYRLGVISSGLAERLGRRLAVEVDTFFEHAKTNTMLNTAELTKLVETALSAWRENDAISAAEEIQRFGRTILAPQERATAWADLAMAMIHQNGAGASVYDAGFVSETAGKAGLGVISDEIALDAGGRALSMGLAAHYLQSAVTMASMHGLANGRKRLPVEDWQGRLDALEAHLGLTGPHSPMQTSVLGNTTTTSIVPSEPCASPSPAVTPATVASEISATAEVVLFSKLVDVYLTTRIDAGEVKVALRGEMASSLRLWLQTVGDFPITHYKRTDFLQFRSVLQRTPKIYWRSDASRKFTILEIVEQARTKALSEWTKSASDDQRNDIASTERAARDYIRIANVTINRHLSTIAPVFTWASQNGYLPDDGRPFWENLHVPTGIKVTGLKANEERPAYTHDQILEIAQHPVWLGRKSDYFYNSPGNVIVRDSLYWGFPMALLHGLRREEFAQLKVKHVRQVDGIWVFDLHAIDVDVKKGASRRYVPLHSKFMALGFLEAMVTGRAKSDRLFEELSADGELDVFGDELGKRFARVVDHLEIKVIRKNGTESDGGYHPLRHRFITDLLRAGVPAGLVDSLSGQASSSREGERIRYNEDPPVVILKEAIEQLPVVVDFEPWIEAWKRYGKP